MAGDVGVEMSAVAVSIVIGYTLSQVIPIVGDPTIGSMEELSSEVFSLASLKTDSVYAGLLGYVRR